jgi:Co/Zn/Cd efflux system component
MKKGVTGGTDNVPLQRPLQFALGLLLTAKYFGAYWMDSRMGIVGAVLMTRWSWDLLTATACVLLDRQAPDAGCAKIRKVIEAGDDAHITDLHVWSVGPGIRAAIIAVVAHNPKCAADYKKRVTSNRSLRHVTVEVHRCPN